MIIPGDDQIFAHSAAVNTTISGPESALEESHWYKMQDITDTVAADVKPYKVFTALLTQSGGTAPVATVLENTIGVMSLQYSYPGNYSITSVEFNGFADYGKVAVLFTNGGSGYFTRTQYVPPINGITITTLNNLNTATDGLINNATIEIRLYN